MPNDDRPTTLHCLCFSLASAATLRSVVLDNDLDGAIRATELALHDEPVFLPELLQDPSNRVAIFLGDPIARFAADFSLRSGNSVDEGLLHDLETPPTLLEFKTPNDLAEALSASDRNLQDRAYVATNSLSRSSQRYADFLVGADYLASRRRRIVFVGSLETYAADVRQFFQGLGVEREIDVPDESAPSLGGDRELSPLAVRNLQAWYAGDIAIFLWASALRERSLAAMPRNRDARVRELYVDRPFVAAYRDHMNLRIRSDPHAAIGGNWEEMGQMQLDFLVARGLAPHHRLLDLGCGTLRAGRHFIRLLEAGNFVFRPVGGGDRLRPATRRRRRAQRAQANAVPHFWRPDIFRAGWTTVRLHSRSVGIHPSAARGG